MATYTPAIQSLRGVNSCRRSSTGLPRPTRGASCAGRGVDAGRAGGLAARLRLLHVIGHSDSVSLARANRRHGALLRAYESQENAARAARRAVPRRTRASGAARGREKFSRLHAPVFGAPPARQGGDGFPFYTWAEARARGGYCGGGRGDVRSSATTRAGRRACLDFRRGARPSLAGDAGLRENRERVGAKALSLRYAPRCSVSKPANLGAGLRRGLLGDPRADVRRRSWPQLFTRQSARWD